MKKKELQAEMDRLGKGVTFDYGEGKIQRFAETFREYSHEDFKKIVNKALDECRLLPQISELRKIAADIRIFDSKYQNVSQQNKNKSCAHCDDTANITARTNNEQRFGEYNGLRITFECGFCDLGEDYQRRYKERKKNDASFRQPNRQAVWGPISCDRLKQNYVLVDNSVEILRKIG